MSDQLILMNTNKNKSLPGIETREAFIKRIPTERILEEFRVEFEKQNYVTGPDSDVDITEIVDVFIEVKNWVNKTLKDGMFEHKINLYIDKLNDYLYWEYEIEIKNAMISFIVVDDTFDPYDQIKTGTDLTPRTFVDYIGEMFDRGNIAIGRFNEVVSTVKPKLPRHLPVDDMLNEIMENTERHMMPRDNGRHTEVFQENIYDTWIIGDALKDVKRYKLTRNGSAFIEYDTFYMPNEGWILIEAKLQLKGVGVRFLLNKREISYYDEKFGDEFVAFYKNFIDDMQMAIRNWNWLVDGGNSKKSRVKNGKYKITGR